MLRCFVVIAMLLCASSTTGEQLADSDFQPIVTAPTFAAGTGPVVCVDEAHHNLHTLDDRYFAFGELLRRDGYVLRANTAIFEPGTLAACDILVISNARRSPENRSKKLSPTPSAFTPAEISATRNWVERGGSLLLIADHMPFAGAAMGLAGAFEIEFTNGYVFPDYSSGMDPQQPILGQISFHRPTGPFEEQTKSNSGATGPDPDGTLADHPIVRGSSAAEAVERVRTFTGQAFRASANAQPLLVLPDSAISLYPSKAWAFGSDTRKVAVGGWLQGATLEVGAGRAAFFGEAGMFSAQLTGPNQRPVGMNAPGAEQNPQFILNVLHWLSGEL